MTTDHAGDVSISRFLRFVRGAVGTGLAFAAALGGVIAVLKWLFGGNDLRAAMIEAVAQGWPFLGFLLGGAVASARALYELTDNSAYRLGAGVALGAAFLLVWLSLGVGIIGRDGDPANLMYFGVLAVGIIGALIARFQPRGMARALFATALAQTSVAAIALIAGLGYPWSGPLELSVLNGFFVALFVGSAWLFQKAARAQSPTGAGPEG